MDILLSIIIFLLAVISGTLILIYFSVEHASEHLAQVMNHLAAEQRAHADSSATVLLKERRIATQAVLKELRAAAQERRELLNLARGDCEIGHSSHVSFVESDSLPSIPPPPRFAHVDPDALTPVSGYPLADLFKEEKTK